MFKLSKCSKTFIKLSGCFSEMTASLKTAPVDEIFLALQPYLVVVLATFGPSRYVSGEHFSSYPPEEVIANSPLTDRILFGSDWPVNQLSLSSSL
jgi:predicted TIM-barrel fold metal-dependent hydrolase